MGRRRRLAIESSAILVLVLVAGASSLRHWYQSPEWTNDGLFYAAQMLQVRGMSEAQARHVVFDGPIARSLREKERAMLPPEARRVDNPRWVRYSARFYERRWLVPVAAAGLYPWLGLRSIEIVSLIGYVLAGLLLYLLMRRTVRIEVAAAVATLCLLLPSFRTWSFFPLTDSWGIALEAGCLAAAALTLERGLAFLPLWIFGIAALSITRDVSIVLAAAAVWLLVRGPTVRRAVLFASGVAAALPALLIAGAPLRTQLAWAFSGYHVPDATSWSFVADRYWPAFEDQIARDVRWHLPTVILFFIGIAGLFVRRGGEQMQMIRASAVLAIVYFAAVPVYTEFRLELVLLPMVAVGVACILEAGAQRLAPLWRS